jgi:hypothetical protein
VADKKPEQPKKTQIIDSKGKRDYNPFEDIHEKYAKPGTVIRGDELPNNQPYMRPLTEQEMKDLKKKGYAKGGFVPFGKKGEKGEKPNPFAKKRFAKGGDVAAKFLDRPLDTSVRRPKAPDVDNDVSAGANDGGFGNYKRMRDMDADVIGKPREVPTADNSDNMEGTGGVRTKQTFAQAFREARKEMGPGKTFTWNGKKYSTDRPGDSDKRMAPAMAKIAAHERRKMARDAAESQSDMPGYRKGGRVGYAKGGMVGCGTKKMAGGGSVARGMGCALRGGKYST